MKGGLLIAPIVCVALSACAGGPTAPLQTATLAAPATAAIKPAGETAGVRGTPVVAERPARMYVMAGFKEADCSPVVPRLSLAKPPSKGQITFRPNQSTTIQHSGSGKCTGKILPGTGIYYTARKGAVGDDNFTVTASTGTDAPTTRTFQVRIVD